MNESNIRCRLAQNKLVRKNDLHKPMLFYKRSGKVNVKNYSNKRGKFLIEISTV